MTLVIIYFTNHYLKLRFDTTGITDKVIILVMLGKRNVKAGTSLPFTNFFEFFIHNSKSDASIHLDMVLKVFPQSTGKK